MATDIKAGIDALAAPAPPPGEQYQIAAYADRTAIREAMERFKAGLRVKNATEHEYAALAHVALKYDLDPFNGDAWIIPNHGVALGIKGLRKLANRQARERGIRWWTEFHDVRNNEEAERYGIPTNGVAVAKICVLRRSDLIEAYVETLRSIREIAGDIPFDQLQAIIGTPPIFTGVGYVLQSEKSVMPLGQLAMKRAETHAIRQAFDVEYRVEELEPDTDIDVTVERPQLAIEPDATEGELIEDAPEKLRETAARISASLYGSDDDDTDLAPPSPSIVTQARPSPSIVTQARPSPSIVTQARPSPSIVTQAPPVEGEVVEEGEPEPKASPKQRPYDAETFRKGYTILVNKSRAGNTPSDKQVQYVRSLMSSAFKDSSTARADRLAVLEWLTGRTITSTKDLTGAEASVLIDILRDETGEISREAYQEMQNCLVEAMKAQGQGELFPDQPEAA